MLIEAFSLLRWAERPVLIFGAGVRLAGAAREARDLARLTRIPVAPTWGARDLFPAAASAPVDLADVYGYGPSAPGWVEPACGGYLCVGGFGTHGTRAANFAVQNADWILSVGSRLDSKATGTPREHFARAARIFMVDIDPAEIAKFRGGLGQSFQGAQADAKLFLRDAIKLVKGVGRPTPELRPIFTAWRARCEEWLRRYPAVPPGAEQQEGLDPYLLIKRLSEHCRPGDLIVADTGLSLAWLMQAFDFKPDQQFIHALNQTPMGCGLPAAIGASYAAPGRRVVLVTGDGGFMLNVQELSVLQKHQLPIKIVLFNNGGHAMCRQTQEQWLGGKYYSTSLDGGLAFPSFPDVSEAFSVRSCPRLVRNSQVDARLSELLRGDAPALLEAVISPDCRLTPQVQYGMPIEDGNPQLSREELREQMIVGVVR